MINRVEIGIFVATYSGDNFVKRLLLQIIISMLLFRQHGHFAYRVCVTPLRPAYFLSISYVYGFMLEKRSSGVGIMCCCNLLFQRNAFPVLAYSNDVAVGTPLRVALCHIWYSRAI
jgi:hypothetical protein